LQRHSGPGPLDWLSAFSAGEAALLLLGVCLVVFLFGAGALFVHLLAENERLAARVDALEAQPGAITNDQTGGLPVGAPAPPFTLPSLDGRSVSLAQLQAPGKPIIVVFSDINCGPCRALQPELEAWQHDHGARLTLAVVSRGTASAHSTGADAGGGPPLLLQHDREVADAYQAPATPTAVLVRPDGTIGSQPALGAHAIATLVANTAAVAAPRRLPAPRTTVAASASTASVG
jgi:peroxiredoxin